jgi:cephalosporin hydroxylase
VKLPAQLEALKKSGWSGFRPIENVEPVGRTGRGLKDALAELDTTPRVIVEIGAEMGGSTRRFAGTFPDAVICSVDPWFEDYPLPDDWRHLKPKIEADRGSLFNLYRTFCAPYRDRVIPVRGLSHEVLPRLHGVDVDLVYLDGDHRHLGLLADLVMTQMLFPAARVIGDDWKFNPSGQKYKGHAFPVQDAVRDFCDHYGKSFKVFNNTFLLTDDKDAA